MLNLNTTLRACEEKGRIIQTGVVGAGQMGQGLVSQLMLARGMRPAVLADHTLEKAKKAYILAGADESDIIAVTTAAEAEAAIKRQKYAVCEDFEIITQCGLIDAVVDATGITDAGAQIAGGAIREGKHIVMLNVECDVTIGHVLAKDAKSAGVVYTASAGDEPGAVKELYDFADAIGLDILVMGKGKNNKVDLESTPQSVYAEATARGIAPRMLCAFKDGTKTMVEMTCMSNSTGFLPDVRGAHGPAATLENICEVLDLKENGGILNGYKTIEYVDGIAPGVFIIVTTHLPQIHHEIQYLKIGKGPNYCLFRPFHLCSLETPVSVARAVIYNEATLIPVRSTPYSETITLAKKDLKAGEYLDGIGGYSVYGSFEKYETAKAEALVPVGLIDSKTKLIRDVAKGTALTYADVRLDTSSSVYQMRMRQQKELG